MTAKHRKGKGNHKHEDNFFKNEVIESEVRAGGTNYTLLMLLLLTAASVFGGAAGAWFCFQQHQTLTYLTDGLASLQLKVVKLQALGEDSRQSSGKQHISESLETRLNALEESYALAQKQVDLALATAEQLKTSDLPAQVLSLHAEMKSRLEEVQQSTVSQERVSLLETTLKGKSEEFEGVRAQVQDLASLSRELFQEVGVLTENLKDARLKLSDGAWQVAALSTALDGQAAEVHGLKETLNAHQARLEANAEEMATVRELVENEQSLRLQQAIAEEQLDKVVGEVQPPAETVEPRVVVETAQEEAARAIEGEEEEEEALAINVEKEVEADEQGEMAAQDEAPAEQEVSVVDEAAPAEEMEQGDSVALSEKEVETTQKEEEEQSIEEEMPEEEKDQGAHEEEESEGEKIQEQLPVEENSHKTEEEEEREVSQTDKAVEEMASEGEKALEESPLEEEEANAEEEVEEWEKNEQDAAEEEEPLEKDALQGDECE